MPPDATFPCVARRAWLKRAHTHTHTHTDSPVTLTRRNACLAIRVGSRPTGFSRHHARPHTGGAARKFWGAARKVIPRGPPEWGPTNGRLDSGRVLAMLARGRTWRPAPEAAQPQGRHSEERGKAQVELRERASERIPGGNARSVVPPCRKSPGHTRTRRWGASGTCDGKRTPQ